MEHSDNRRPTVAAFGEWESVNLGDRAILEGVGRFFHRAGWRVDAYGVCSLLPTKTLLQSYPQPARPQDINSCKGRILEPTFNGLRNRHPGAYRFLKLSLRPLRQTIRIRRLLPMLRNAQLILVGGGGVLSDSDLHFPQSLAAITWAANRLQLPMMCLGCGADGEWSAHGQKLIADFAKCCTLIATRDRHTANCLAEVMGVPVRVFGDFAWSPMRLMNTPVQKQASPTLAINVMRLSKRWENHQERYEDVLVKTINAWMGKNRIINSDCVRLFTTECSADIDPAKRVLMRLSKPGAVLHVPTRVEELRMFLRSSTAVVASRLHAAILAIAENIPVIGFTVSPKIEFFFESLGIQQYCVSVFDDQFVHKASRMLDDCELARQRKIMEVTEMVESQNMTLSILQEMMGKT